MGVSRVMEAAQSLVLGLVALVTGPPHVVLVGLDSSGKTTALLRLKYGQYVNAVPTVGFNCEKVRCGGGHWLVWDVGGAERVRPLWRSYTRATDALVFVVDSSSSMDRLEEARLELHRMTRQQSSECVALNRARPPLLVLANKQDLPGAKDTQQLAKSLGLTDLPHCQPWAVAAACAVTGEGLDDAMVALHHLLLKTRKMHRSRK
ncbi:ADP-ribosylation factor-like protein 4C [Homarus americanus]|uniref:ADP-ribosylation factor-like protein 4C-like 1 n=1 Tax=Homarus americanus TaxID=6706 RepID=A0A8J5JMV5_HOMAM|nr:ADP-ribosylation factor-like protein 4C [Homarus americanus]KAG7159228.1 ADP-ribosylation factor-like protein 4C-like 1 [Homarus americanus]